MKSLPKTDGNREIQQTRIQRKSFSFSLEHQLAMPSLGKLFLTLPLWYGKIASAMFNICCE